MAESPSQETTDSRRVAATRRGLFAFFLIVAVVAGAWWFQMPQGFPAGHPRFWMNTALPILTVLLCGLGMAAAIRDRRAILNAQALLFGSAAVAGSAAAKCVFPVSVSGRSLLLVILIGGAGLWLPISTFCTFKSSVLPKRVILLLLLTGIATGVFVTWSQRAGDPTTCPSNVVLSAPPQDGVDVRDEKVRLSDAVCIYPGRESVTIAAGRTVLEIRPLLTFISRSPDRCWTVLAPPTYGHSFERRLNEVVCSDRRCWTTYADDGASSLVADTGSTGTLQLEAISELPQAVYSHLNSFCQIQIEGTGVLAVKFSPCPTIVELKPSDYPAGRPARLAYVDADQRFRVVEAHSGEKGPFTTLTEGALEDGDPLDITVLDSGREVFRISMDDWAAQASMALSPTAGWGLPENAIEFSLVDTACGSIYFTLAGTSVGRGWDSVGHAAGVYRNRMKVEILSAPRAVGE